MRIHRIALVFVTGFVVGALLASAAITLTATQDSSPRAINLPGRTTTAPFSDAVLVGNTLYVAGRLGMDPDTGRPPASPAQEARNILDGIQAVLAEADMTMDDLVNVQVFCSDVSLYGEFNQVYTEYFNDDPPARAFLGSGPLLFGARFEVNGIAVKG
ncbi:MAG: RidA family protein [Acidobacteria bacterium]|nr:RidA family protein [Acidobacteriota bacterium]